jgi:quercetin dioxygenase-like cupin family protein
MTTHPDHPTDPADPTVSDPGLYAVVFENERVRVLEYRDRPGDRTSPHRHPDSVMITLGAFRRRVSAGEREVEVALEAGQVRWLAAQEHSGANIGETGSHAIFIELKEPAPGGPPAGPVPLGPSPLS